MLCFVFAALIVVLDQLFKRWIVLTLAVNEETVIINGVVNLLHVRNSGAAFSILPEQRWLLAGIAFVAALVLIAILLRYNEGFWGTLGLASVLGGTVGNLIDRVFHGYVVDMFRTTFMTFAIFNIADIFITLGGITFCVFFIVSSTKSGRDRLEDPVSVSDDDESEPADDDYEYQEEHEEIDYDKLFYEDTEITDDFDAPAMPKPVHYENDYEYEQDQPDFDTFAMKPADYDGAGPAGLDADYETEPIAYIEHEPEPPAAASPALNALETLESELTELVENYDLDDLLRDYGFEDDED